MDYIQLGGKKYKVADLGPGAWQPVYARQKKYSVGLTGLSIIQDFTVSSRVPRQWPMTLRVFISTPWPDNSWGTWADLLAAFNLPTVTFIEFDGTSHTVGIPKPLTPRPRVGANLDGHCNGIYFVPVNLIKVYQ